MLGIGAPGGEAHAGTLAFLPPFHVIGFTNNFLFNILAGVRAAVGCDMQLMSCEWAMNAV